MSGVLLVGILGMTPKPVKTNVSTKPVKVSVAKAKKPKVINNYKASEITETKIAITKEYNQILEVK